MALAPIPLVSGMTRVTRAWVIDTDSGTEHEVGVTTADVTVDRKSECRRALTATIGDDVDPALLSAPHRLRIQSGYRVGGRDVLAPLAHVRLGKRSRTPLGLWQVSGTSFESLVRGARFAVPRRVEGSAVAAIAALIREAVPWATVVISTTRDIHLPGSGLVFPRELLEAIVGREESLATAVGVDVYCDGDGQFVIADPPSLASQAWDTRGFVSDWSESVDPSGVVNSWVVSTDHPDVDPTRGIADDNDAWSPTRISRWGMAREFLSSPVLSSEAEAKRAAATLLDGSRGVRVDMDLTTPPNPWADVTEPVTAVGSGGAGTFLLDRLTHRVSHDLNEQLSMSAAGRRVSLA